MFFKEMVWLLGKPYSCCLLCFSGRTTNILTVELCHYRLHSTTKIKCVYHITYSMFPAVCCDWFYYVAMELVSFYTIFFSQTNLNMKYPFT